MQSYFLPPELGPVIIMNNMWRKRFWYYYFNLFKKEEKYRLLKKGLRKIQQNILVSDKRVVYKVHTLQQQSEITTFYPEMGEPKGSSGGVWTLLGGSRTKGVRTLPRTQNVNTGEPEPANPSPKKCKRFDEPGSRAGFVSLPLLCYPHLKY